jgi:hypothetical protein
MPEFVALLEFMGKCLHLYINEHLKRMCRRKTVTPKALALISDSTSPLEPCPESHSVILTSASRDDKTE